MGRGGIRGNGGAKNATSLGAVPGQGSFGDRGKIRKDSKREVKR